MLSSQCRGHAREDFSARGEIFVSRNDSFDCLGNMRQVTFDLCQTAPDLPGKQAVPLS